MRSQFHRKPICFSLAVMLAGGMFFTAAAAAQEKIAPRPVPADNPMWAHMRKNLGSDSGPGSRSLSPREQAQLGEMHEQALAYFRRGDLARARGLWREMLNIDPQNVRARTFLEQTEAEAARIGMRADSIAAQRDRYQATQRLLEAPVTLQTDRPIPLAEFMRLLSFSTPVEIEYVISDAAETPVYANFVDRPLGDVLDAVLRPIGFDWDITGDNMIAIQSNLRTRTYRLTTDQMNKVRALLDAGTLQNVIWGQELPPMRGAEMTLDERERVLTASGSAVHVAKLTDFLASMEVAATPDLETRIYKINSDDGPKIRAMINAIIDSDARTPFQLERKVYLDGDDLIIRDTPENLVRIEELLLDEQFVDQLRDEELAIVNFSLIPREVEQRSSDQVRFFTSRVYEAVQTLLYARTGKEQAARQGRRAWFDETTLQLTIVDTPTNIARVGQYIESLPELRQRRQQEVVQLEYARAEDIAAQVSQVLGLQPPPAIGGERAGEQVVKRLRRGEQFTFRDIRVRMIRVEEGDPNDRDDDQVELQIISGTQSNQITLTELETTFFENYEITAENVQPSGGGGGGGGATGRQGEGTATIVIRYIEPLQ